MSTSTVAPVRRTITVEVPREHAFAVFTERFDAWWPRSHKIGGADLAEAVIEPRAGGRWYEKDVDGSECDWGRVLAWEPPGRLLLAWQIDATWQYDPDLVTEVEVLFVAETEHRTRVEVEHRHLERFGRDEAEMRAQFGADGGWTGLLTRYAEAVTAG